MKAFLKRLRSKCVVGLVGGSDFGKVQEQMDGTGEGGSLPGGEGWQPLVELIHLPSPLAVEQFDFVFGENGLTAYHQGQVLESQVCVPLVAACRRLCLWECNGAGAEFWSPRRALSSGLERKSTRSWSTSASSILQALISPSNGKGTFELVPEDTFETLCSQS